METFAIPADDWEELARLSIEAAKTPVIAMTVADGLAGRDWASQARERALAKWREIGKRLGFDGTTVEPLDEERRLVRAHPIADQTDRD